MGVPRQGRVPLNNVFVIEPDPRGFPPRLLNAQPMYAQRVLPPPVPERTIRVGAATCGCPSPFTVTNVSIAAPAVAHASHYLVGEPP